MNRLTQENRFITISDFSLGTDTFVITSLQGSEFISGIFEFELELYSDNLTISPDDIIGKVGTVTIKNDIGRSFNGYAKSFSVGEMGPFNHRLYRITLVPWLWFLTKTQDCRIFQEKNTKDIVTTIFDDLGFTDYDFQAVGGTVREYCVQHNESSFDFVSRLLEEDGIAYYFTHTADKHTLVLVDQANSYSDTEETDLEYSKGGMTNTQISHWEHFYEFRKGQWSINDYNFKEPKKNLITGTNTTSQFANNAKFEHYEYPAMYDTNKGADLVKIRLEAEESLRDTAKGSSDCSSFFAGGKFKLAKHDTSTEQNSYVLVGVHHRISDSSFFAGGEGQSDYANDFTCVPADVHFRPSPIHQRPVMKGPQSALVVGPAGEEIYIDEHCRIKVQFYWDRVGEKDENSTCFIRVSQSWAGNQWGSSFIPRIGHEVIVNFLDGDPDRPLVTGSVYNAWNKPVYSSKTQSGIKTRSTKGGDAQNFNELRFEDLKDSEQIYIHAEKDFDTQVENNQTLTIDNDRAKHIKHDETANIDNNRDKTVGVNQTETIGKNKTIDVGANHSETIGKNKTLDVGANHSESIADNMTLSVGGNQSISVDKNMTLSVSKNLSETVDGKHTEQVTKEYSLKAKAITIEADDQITFKTGSAKIIMKKNGDITISGKNINVKGSGNVVLKGSKVTAN